MLKIKTNREDFKLTLEELNLSCQSLDVASTTEEAGCTTNFRLACQEPQAQRFSRRTQSNG